MIIKTLVYTHVLVKVLKQQIKYINRFEKIITAEDHIKSGV